MGGLGYVTSRPSAHAVSWVRNWPPAWTWTGGPENSHPRGKIGILWEVMPSKILPVKGCFLYIEHEGSEYIGCLLFNDTAFCNQIIKLLQGCCNRPIPDEDILPRTSPHPALSPARISMLPRFASGFRNDSHTAARMESRLNSSYIRRMKISEAINPRKQVPFLSFSVRNFNF
jgi:hypothetical protein